MPTRNTGRERLQSRSAPSAAASSIISPRRSRFCRCTTAFWSGATPPRGRDHNSPLRPPGLRQARR
jgi:hypothetical protein